MTLQIDTTTYRSPNFNSRPFGQKPIALLLHTTEGAWPSDAAWLSSVASQVSSHYVISPQAKVYQLVNDDKRAWHAGVGTYAGFGDWNNISIGIEVSHIENHPWTPGQREVLRELCLILITKYSITQQMIAAHRWIAPARRRDPTDFPDGELKPWIAGLYGTSVPVPASGATRIIGVNQTVTADQFWRSIERNMPIGGIGEPMLSRVESDYIYGVCERFNVDAAAVLGIWAHEQGLPYGSSALGKLTRNPFNMRAPAGDWRWVVNKPGSSPPQPFYAYESWQIGLTYAVLHLKNFYGAYKHLYTLEEVIPVFAPTSDGNDPVAYIEAVKRIMTYIKAN